MLLATVLLGPASLFPSLAPPPPGELLSKVAEIVLRARLRECGAVQVQVKDTGGLLFGSVEGVRVSGRRWSTPLKLSCRSLDVSVGRTAIDFGALAAKQRIVLQRPSTGKAEISFTADDWDSFLAHPLFQAAVAAKCAATSANVVFVRGGTRLCREDETVVFPVRWCGELCDARLSQAGGRATIVLQREADGEGGQMGSDWLTALFNELVIDLDGCELRFLQLRFSDDQLSLALDVRVRSFPSLDVNF